MNVFIAWEVDRLDGLLAASMMADNVSELKRISQDLGKAANIVRSWAMASGGCTVLDLLAKGCVEVPAEKMTELPGIRRQFQTICDGTLSMGVGMVLNEAFNAVRAAKVRGGDQITLFVPEMMEEVSEESSLAEDLLGKGEGDATPPAGEKNDEPTKADEKPQQDETAPQEAKPESDSPAGPAQPAPEEDKSPKGAIMAALKDIKANADAIEQLKQSSPQAFKAVTEVVQAMIMMAESMQDAPKE